MKKLLPILLSLLLLTGCSQKEDVTYYISKSVIQQKTGDINVRAHTYDEHWNPLSATITVNGNFSSKTEYTYSEDFSVVTQNSVSAIYEPDTTTTIRTFDGQGLVITAEIYDADRLISTAVNTYDDGGNLIKSVQTAPDSSVAITITRRYDRKGNLLTLQTDTGYAITRQEYTYDQHGHRIREEYYQNDVLNAYSDFQWKGNTAYGTNCSADGTPGFTMMLVYDDAGNVLVNEIKDVNGNLQSRTYNEYVGSDGSISSGLPKEMQTAK